MNEEDMFGYFPREKRKAMTPDKPEALTMEEIERHRTRFLKRVMPEPNSGCWLWLGTARSNRKSGIPMICFSMRWPRKKSRTHHAHRAAYLLWNGEIADDLQVRHTCDNHYCVNPGHLILGTAHDNRMDRAIRSNNDGIVKLGREAVAAMRQAYERGESSIPKLAVQYGVSYACAWDAITGRKWKHVGASVTGQAAAIHAKITEGRK